MEESLANLNPLEYEEVTVELESVEQEGVELAQRTIVGKVFSEKILNRGAFKTVVSQAWGVPDGLQISDLGPNIYLFTFKEKKESMEIMKRGPWFVMNHLLNLQRWIPEASVFEIDFAWVPFWVQLHGMPFGSMSMENASKIASQIGKIVDIENPMVDGCLVRSFIRVRVLVNVFRPLLTGCWIPRYDLPKAWVVFRYEKLQGMCFNCGIIGHEQMSCKKEKVMAVINKEVARYSAQLSIPMAKPIQIIAHEYGRWKTTQRNQRAGDSSLRRSNEEDNNAGSGAQYQWDEGHSSIYGRQDQQRESNRDLTSLGPKERGDMEGDSGGTPNLAIWAQVMEAFSVLQAEEEHRSRGGEKDRENGQESIFQAVPRVLPMQEKKDQKGKGDEGMKSNLPDNAPYHRGRSEGTGVEDADRGGRNMPIAGQNVYLTEPVTSNRPTIKKRCPDLPLGSLPFTNLRLQYEFPGFKEDRGKNHVRLGQMHEREGLFAEMGPLSHGPDHDIRTLEEKNQTTLSMATTSKGDSKEKMIKPAQWREHLAQIQLEEECIGLGDPEVVREYSRPDFNSVGYGGIALSETDIEKCRKACGLQVIVGENERDDQGSRGGSNVGDHEGSTYFVESPVEDGEEGLKDNSALSNAEEDFISQGLSKLFHAKRPRISWAGEDPERVGEDAQETKRHKMERESMEWEADEVDAPSSDYMAEEASLTTPPAKP